MSTLTLVYADNTTITENVTVQKSNVDGWVHFYRNNGLIGMDYDILEITFIRGLELTPCVQIEQFIDGKSVSLEKHAISSFQTINKLGKDIFEFLKRPDGSYALNISKDLHKRNDQLICSIVVTK